MELVNPCGAFETKSEPLTARKPLSRDTIVGLLPNDKKNADVLLTHLQRRLEQEFSIQEFAWFRKEATQPAEFPDEFVARVDVVAAAVCD